jgi:hypothetical protein
MAIIPTNIIYRWGGLEYYFIYYFTTITGHGNPKKRVLRIYDKTLVVIDESLVCRLGINDDTWFEQEQAENGIFLKIVPVMSAI